MTVSRRSAVSGVARFATCFARVGVATALALSAAACATKGDVDGLRAELAEVREMVKKSQTQSADAALQARNASVAAQRASETAERAATQAASAAEKAQEASDKAEKVFARSLRK